MIETKHWTRFQQRLDGAKGGWSDLWLAAASIAFGVSVSAGIGFLTVPSNSPDLPDGIRPILLTIAIASFVVAVMGFIAWLVTRSTRDFTLSELCEDMKLYNADESSSSS